LSNYKNEYLTNKEQSADAGCFFILTGGDQIGKLFCQRIHLIRSYLFVVVEPQKDIGKLFCKKTKEKEDFSDNLFCH